MPYRSYVLALLSFAFFFGAGLILLCAVLLRSGVLVEMRGGIYEAQLIHHLTYVPQPGEILVVGDSGAMSSIKPEAVSREIGAPVVDFGLGSYSGWRSYQLMVERYFAAGARPRAVVIALAAVTPFYLASDNAYYDKLLGVGAFGGWLDTLKELLRSPDGPPTVIYFATGIFMSYLTSRAYRSRFAVNLEELRRNKGFMPIEQWDPISARERLAPDCHIDSRQYTPGPAALAGLQNLKGYVESRGVPVFVYIEPMPECDAALKSFADVYGGVANNTLTALPSQLFVSRTHLHRKGVRVASQDFANFMRGALAEPGQALSQVH